MASAVDKLDKEFNELLSKRYPSDHPASPAPTNGSTHSTTSPNARPLTIMEELHNLWQAAGDLQDHITHIRQRVGG
jgi:hypothetical protein